MDDHQHPTFQDAIIVLIALALIAIGVRMTFGW